MKRGRPAGGINRCSFCGELGHIARNGSCSGSALALDLIDESGLSYSAAALEVGVSSSAVSHAARRRRVRLGEPVTVQRISRSDLAAAWLQSNGGTLAAAGKRFGISRQAVQQALRRAQWIAEAAC